MMKELTLQKLSFPIANLTDRSDFNRIKESLKAIADVEVLTMENGNLNISYYHDAVSAGTVRRTIDSPGYKIEEKSKTKNPFKRFVTRLAESNKKTSVVNLLIAVRSTNAQLQNKGLCPSDCNNTNFYLIVVDRQSST